MASFLPDWTLSLHPARRWTAGWQGRCVLCQDWGPHTLCRPCRTAWRPPVERCPRCALPWSAGGGCTAALDTSIDTQGSPANCPDCEAHSPEFDRAIAAVHYTAPWSTLVSRLKFQRAAALGEPLGRLLAEAVRLQAPNQGSLGGAAGRPDVVLPMPVSAQRRQERGYNQSWLLARACARHLQLPCRDDVLHRVQHTTRLMDLSAEERALALTHAFRVSRRQQHWAEGAHVALVDDVLTTGATADAACRALRDAGARSISLWVLARTPLARPRQDGGVTQALGGPVRTAEPSPFGSWPAAA